MLIQYIQAAMRQAHCEQMANGRFFGRVPACEGCWDEGATPEECREDLEEALQKRIILGLRLGHVLPVAGGVDINPWAEMEHAQTHLAGAKWSLGSKRMVGPALTRAGGIRCWSKATSG
jgi:hypothetical protein